MRVSLCALFAVWFFLFFGGLAEVRAENASTPHHGYVADVDAEKAERYYEIYFFVPDTTKQPSLQEQIFNPLTKEFKEKYRDKFGQLDTESIPYQQTNFDLFDLRTESSQEVEQENDKRREFAEYMTKRIMEFHVDNYMKTQPQMRPIMEVKQKIQNVKVEVSKSVRLNMQYNFSNNSADLMFENPWCESKVTLEMDPHSFGPGNIQETRIWMNKDLNSHWKFNSNAALTDGIIYGDFTRRFRPNMSGFVGAQAAFQSGGTSPRETRWLVGYSYNY